MIANFLARTVELAVHLFADAIGTGAAPSFPQTSVLKGVQNLAIAREHGNANAHPGKIGLHEIARGLRNRA